MQHCVIGAAFTHSKEKSRIVYSKKSVRQSVFIDVVDGGGQGHGLLLRDVEIRAGRKSTRELDVLHIRNRRNRERGRGNMRDVGLEGVGSDL